jgi:hypothetical protein
MKPNRLSQLECAIYLGWKWQSFDPLGHAGNFHLLMRIYLFIFYFLFIYFFWDGGTYSNLVNVVSVGLLPILVFFH